MTKLHKNLEEEILEIIRTNLPIKIVRAETVSPRTNVVITENELAQLTYVLAAFVKSKSNKGGA